MVNERPLSHLHAISTPLTSDIKRPMITSDVSEPLYHSFSHSRPLRLSILGLLSQFHRIYLRLGNLLHSPCIILLRLTDDR